MGDILKKITELLNDGADIEQQRSTGIIIKSSVGWFDAIDCGTREATPKGEGDKKADSGDIQKCRNKDLNEDYVPSK